MADPMNTNPRLVDPPAPADPHPDHIRDTKDANSVWGWIAGGIALLVLVLLIFGNMLNPSNTAGLGDQNFPRTTATTPTERPAPAKPPATTGQVAR